MADIDPFAQNILGAENLVGANMNKTKTADLENDVGELVDSLELPMSDVELISLSNDWKNLDDRYSPELKGRTEKNLAYYKGTQRSNGMAQNSVVDANLIFEAEETFLPQALSKNPEPVVWSDNTQPGKDASNDIKTMLQYHADVLCLRRKLGVMVRQWNIYFIGVVKHGWDKQVNDIKLELRKPQNFIWDPDGYINEKGEYCGRFLGERINVTAERLIELFPKKKAEIIIKCDGKLGTDMQYTEWRTDTYAFYRFQDLILDKHKNEFFNYEGPSEGVLANNHFAVPKMPYTFLSVFSLQEHPHDITNLIEQSIPNQDSINNRTEQVERNLRNGNNSIALSGLSFNKETARQAARALEDGDPVLVPDGQVENAIKRIPASPLPNGVLQALQADKDALRGVFGTQGLSAEKPNENTTARGLILNQNHDATRIGGGIGDALAQVADNIFNWWLQLYYVFYDEPHYGAIMGNGRAVEYVAIQMSDQTRRFVVSVVADSMKPKDELAEVNEAIKLWETKALDPISLFQRLNDADPIETAKKVSLWTTNPQLYMMQYFPENAGPNSTNPPNPNNVAPIPSPFQPSSLANNPQPGSLGQVPINQGPAQPKI